MRRRRVWLVVLTSYGLALWFMAAGQAQQVPSVTLKSEAELVLVPTSVSEGGKPVRGLTAQDFVLLHDGETENIAVFEEVEATPASVQRPPLPPHTVQNYASELSPQQQAKFATSGFGFSKRVALTPGRYEVRVLLRDNVGHKMGTVSTLVDLTGPPSKP